MPSVTPTLKRHNHRVHPCKSEKKDELLEFLLNKNNDKNIIVVTSTKTKLTTKQENVIIVSDEELASNSELKCEMLISYDLPAKAITYMSRIDRTTTYAAIILDASQEKLIHPIETLIGRTIMQEIIEGFYKAVEQKQVQPTKKESKPKKERREFNPRDEKKPYKNKKRSKSPKLTGKKINIKPLKKKEDK